MTSGEYIKHIRDLIAAGELGKALENSRLFLENTPKLDEAIHQSGRYESIRKQIRLGVVSHSDASLTQNQIRFSLLELLRDLENGGIGAIDSNKIFIFHNPADHAWVENQLVPQLEKAGLSVHLDSRKYSSEDWQRLSRTVADCKATLIVFSGKFNRVEQWLIDGLWGERPNKLLALRLGEVYVFEEFADPIFIAAGESRAEHFRTLIARLKLDAFPGWEPLDEKFIEISSMPNGGEYIHLFGRQHELQLLDDAWAKRECHILSFVAQGGVGKSALFNRWLSDMSRDHFRGAGRVLATSFYSQGTGERVTSADQFINFALEWFGERDFEQSSPWDKGKRLAQLVSEHRTLLVLDGLEPLQESGMVDTGKIKDPALFTLVRDLAKRNEGLCIITSRLRLGGLERQAAGIRQEELDQISDEAGKRILRFAGIQGHDSALTKVVKEFGNHALAVSLLSAWLYAQPGHNVEAANTIADLPEVPLEKGRHPRRVIVAFEKLMREKGLEEEVLLLRFLGLFDRPVAEEAIAQLHPFKNLYKTLDSLWLLKLIYREKRHPILRKNKEGIVDCHPLVREHYSEVFSKEEPERWQKSHTVLYEYYKGLPEKLYNKYLPDTLDEMEPLFLAVRHGCAAGLHQESFDDVYWERIKRKSEHYCTTKLGAFSSDLTTLSWFYDTLWDKPIQNLNEKAKTAIYGWVGYRLRAIGLTSEASQAMKVSMEMAVIQNDWKNASIATSLLCELFLLRGDLTTAQNYGEQCVEYAKKSGNGLQIKDRLSTYGTVAHSIGDLQKADRLFLEAENVQQVIMPNCRWLFSIPGYWYCDLLLETGQYMEALERGKFNIDLEKEGWMGLIDLALNRLVVGKSLFYFFQDVGTDNYREGSIYYLNEAINWLRNAGRKDYLPNGLLARAAHHRLTKNYLAALVDLEEVLDIVEFSGMRLHLTDFHLETAHLCLAQSRLGEAKLHVLKAARLITETGYHRRDKELEDLERKISQ